MKKVFYSILFATLLLGLTGCGGDKTTDFSPEETVKQIEKKVELPAADPITETLLSDLYNVDPKQVEAYAGLHPVTNVQATEIVILKMKDTSAADAALKAMEQYGNNVEEQWSMYLPEQYELAKNRIVKAKDNVVYFIVAEKPDEVEAVIENAMK